MNAIRKIIKYFTWNKGKRIKSKPILSFEVVDKSKVQVNGEYHYRALVRVKNKLRYPTDVGVIAGKIQYEMGYHPIGYQCFDVNSTYFDTGVLEITWKSWDSCE